MTLPLNIVNFAYICFNFVWGTAREGVRREGKVFHEKKKARSEVDDTVERRNIKGRTRFYRTC